MQNSMVIKSLLPGGGGRVALKWHKCEMSNAKVNLKNECTIRQLSTYAPCVQIYCGTISLYRVCLVN